MAEEIKNIFKERLQHLRLIKKLSLRDLAEKMQNIVSAQTLSNYEKGISFPNAEVMTALVDALDVQIDALFRQPSTSWEDVQFSYRKYKSLSHMDDLSIQALVKEQAEKYMEIEDILSITPNPNFSQLCQNIEVRTPEDACDMAMRVREHLQLAEEPIVNIHELIEQNGIKLIGIEVDRKFDGVDFVCGHHAFVIYNTTDKSSERTRFSIAHELAHLMLNIPEDIDEKLAENLCDAFAGELLLPAARLKALLGERRDQLSLDELKRIQAIYGISVDAIMQSAKNAGIINPTKLKTYHIIKSTRPTFKALADKSVYPKESPNERFESLVYKALSSEVITISKAAYLLGQDIDTVNQHLNLI